MTKRKPNKSIILSNKWEITDKEMQEYEKIAPYMPAMPPLRLIKDTLNMFKAMRHIIVLMIGLIKTKLNVIAK